MARRSTEIVKPPSRSGTSRDARIRYRAAGNAPPIAGDDAYATPQATLLVVNAASGVLANDDDVDLHALTMIDPVTGWFKIIQINEKTAEEVASKLEQYFG